MWAKPENKAHAQELLKREVKKFSQERAEPQRSPISNQTANSETSLYDFGETDDSITSEVDDFLISRNESLGVFNKNAFPNVKRIFMKFNTPEASSALSERLFSGGKLVSETKRNHLGEKDFEKSLLINVNKNL